MNLELSRFQTWFYISVVFSKLFFFRIKIRIVHASSYATIVDRVFTFKTGPEYTVSSREFSITDVT